MGQFVNPSHVNYQLTQPNPPLTLCSYIPEAKPTLHAGISAYVKIFDTFGRNVAERVSVYCPASINYCLCNYKDYNMPVEMPYFTMCVLRSGESV